MTNLTIFNQDKASELFNSTEQFPVSFDDAWQWLEYSRKDPALKSFLACEFAESIDFIVSHQKVENLNSVVAGRPSTKYSLTIDCFKSWAMMSKTATGKQVRLYFLECERIAKLTTQQPRQLSGIEMARENLRLWEDLEAKQALIAAQEVKITQLDAEVEVLSEVVDQLFDYSSIIRVAKHNNVDPGCFKWQSLKAASKTLGLEVKSAPCAIWKTKNLYPHQAWQFVYPEYQLPEATSLVLG